MSTIGLLTIGNFLGYLPQHWLGVVDGAREQGASIVTLAGAPLESPRGFERSATSIFKLASTGVIDGLVVWTSVLDWFISRDEMAAFCRSFAPLPVVSAEVQVDGVPSILVDHYGGMRMALSHLIELHGSQRIAFIRGPAGHLGAQERYRAYCETLQAYQLDCEPKLVSPPMDDWDGRGGINVLTQERGLRPHIDFDAVAGVGDGTASTAIQALQDQGVRVPDDVAVVGFDDNLQARAITPGLTTVNSHIYEVGRKAASTLLAILRGEAPPEKVVVPGRLVIRQSCGCQSTTVIQAGKPVNILTNLSLESLRPESTSEDAGMSFSSQQLETMAEQMSQNIFRFSNGSASEERLHEYCALLIQTFFADLSGMREGSLPKGNFIRTLEDILWQEMEGIDTSAWQEALTTLRQKIWPEIKGLYSLANAESLWHQGRVLIAESAQRSQIRQRAEEGVIQQVLGEVSQAVATAVDMDELMDVLAQELPRLGFSGCCLALYKREAEGKQDSSPIFALPETACLLLAFNSTDGRILLESGGLCYPTRQIVPDHFCKSDHPNNRVILPLYFRHSILGFILFEVERREGALFDPLRAQISSALQTVLVYQEAVHARMAAEQADLLKTRLMAMVSHELRTPLNLIIGLSEMIVSRTGQANPDTSSLQGVDGKFIKQYQEDLRRIHLSAQLLNGLIGDVLDLARSEIGQLKLVCEPLELSSLVQTAAEIGSQWAEDKGLGWRVELPEALPRVWGDRLRLRQVLLNLLGNAFKFTASGEVVLCVTQAENEIIIAVRDTGLGIPPGEQERIFDEFTQSKRTMQRGYGGLGLGLTICKRLVELHNGRIGVLSSGKEGEGSTVYFSLPVLKEEPHSATASPLDRSEQRRVVVLCGQCQRSSSLYTYLKQRGILVETYPPDGTQSLSWLTPQPPAAVILDMEIASEQGWEILKMLKENPSMREIPVLFCSLEDEAAQGSVIELEYLTKPVGASTLVETIARIGLLHSGVGQKNILVVDDEPGVLELHTRMIEAQLPDFKVSKATDGQAALAQMSQQPPDLVLLDLMMPELDGFQVLERMRLDERLKTIPVIVLTGQVLTAEDMSRLNRNVASVLRKGLFSRQETLAHIVAALEREKPLSNEAQRLVRKVMAYIHQYYTQPLDRKTLAEYIGVSESYLSRCFHAEVGLSLTTYLNRWRIQRAKTQLEDSDKNITEIAFEVGFADSNYFTRLFHQEVGMTPSQYRDKPVQTGPTASP